MWEQEEESHFGNHYRAQIPDGERLVVLTQLLKIHIDLKLCRMRDAYLILREVDDEELAIFPEDLGMILWDGVALCQAEVPGPLQFGFTADLKLLFTHVENFPVVNDNFREGGLPLF